MRAGQCPTPPVGACARKTPCAVSTALREGQREVGVAYADAVGRRLGVAQFVDDEAFCELEALLVQLGAKEAVLPKVHDCALGSGVPSWGRGGGAGVSYCFAARALSSRGHLVRLTATTQRDGERSSGYASKGGREGLGGAQASAE